MKAFLFPALLALLLSGCGWAEWPPPAAGKSGAKPAGAKAVIAAKDDTVYTLSRRHGVSTSTIIEANRLPPPYKMTEGQKIALPSETRHVTRRGDTLYGISRSYNVDAYALASANGLKPPYAIIAGKSLRIPGAQTKAYEEPGGEKKSAPGPAPRQAAKLASGSGAGFIWPVNGKVLSGFGPKAKGQHNDGLNISAPRGSLVKAAEDGVVAYAGNELRGFGNLLLVKHPGGFVTAYAHNDVLLAKRGQKVAKGQPVAKVGSTGSVSKPQLHFEIRKGNRAIDPAKHLTSAPNGV